MGKVIERIVNAERVEDIIAVFGSFDENIKRIEDVLNVSIVNRGMDLMRSAGVDAQCQREDLDGEILLTIRIPNRGS